MTFTVFNSGADSVVDISTLGDVTAGDHLMITNNSETDGHFVLGIE